MYTSYMYIYINMLLWKGYSTCEVKTLDISCALSIAPLVDLRGNLSPTGAPTISRRTYNVAHIKETTSSDAVTTDKCHEFRYIEVMSLEVRVIMVIVIGALQLPSEGIQSGAYIGLYCTGVQPEHDQGTLGQPHVRLMRLGRIGITETQYL